MIELNRTAPWPEINQDKAKINICGIMSPLGHSGCTWQEKKAKRLFICETHDSGLRGII